MGLTPAKAIILLNDNGWPVARQLQEIFPDCLIHGLAGRVSDADITFQQTARHLQEIYVANTPIIGICASAILVRCLAPALDNKHVEPPVLAIPDTGKFVVPLLGGHHGANQSAHMIAQHLGAEAAITTACDQNFNIALDEPPADLVAANPEDMKVFVGKLLGGAAVQLNQSHPWLEASDLTFADDGSLKITITDQVLEGDGHHLVFHPRLYHVGVGCERHADGTELINLIKQGLAEAGISPLSLAGVYSINLKSDEVAVHQAARFLGVDPRFFTAEELESQADKLKNPSEVVFQEVGCHGVSEGAALFAAGEEAELILPKIKSKRTTLAIAKSATYREVADLGVPQGKLSVIGIGPGQDVWRTPEASHLIGEASDIVAYGLYTDLLGPAAYGKTRHDFALGEEEKRVRFALDLAASGKNVALISSGDIGIYAMATLVFELIQEDPDAAWDRLDIQVTPGISALQAAAARAGAPLGHDFCTISLSDLLTPWEAIEKRLKAAAIGDFVVAFYNPVSKKRRTQLHAAKAILSEHRPADTPVIVARNLGREDEAVRIMTLEELNPEKVDMLTLVMVGSSESKITQTNSNHHQWAYTPRGYAGKMTVRKKD